MSDQTSQFLTAVHVWAAAAWADGVIADEEAIAMKAVIAASRLSDEEKHKARGWLSTKVELEDVAIANLPEDNRHNIYAAALGVVAIDKDVAEAEVAFLERLAAALEIDEATAEKLKADAGL